MPNSSVREYLLSFANAYQSAFALAAASELDIFTELIKRNGTTLSELSKALDLDERRLNYLLAALVTMEILAKSENLYVVEKQFVPYLDSRNSATVLPMLRHQANCARGWVQLATSIKTGAPSPVIPGVNDEKVEFQDFILAMDVVSKRFVPSIAQQLFEQDLLRFEKMLDLGGASGSYSFAFLEKNPNLKSKAIIFDRQEALKEAQIKAQNSELGNRLEFYSGDFYKDPYPQDVDFVWISAIIHQQNEETTAQMFRQSFNSLRPGGLVAVRDVFINEDQTGPRAAAFFGINMAIRTEQGRVYTVGETVNLLTEAGFQNARLAIPAEDMGAVVVAEKSPSL